MYQTHLHLVINHLAIIGSLLATFVLAFGIWKKSKDTQIAAYGLFILSAIGAVVTYFTGEAAEDAVEHLPGVEKDLIELHEHFSIYPLAAMIILGLLSIAGIYFAGKNPSHRGKLSIVILIFSVISFILIARTGYLGGQIRHSELHAVSVIAPDHGDSEHEHEQVSQVAATVQLNNGDRWVADSAAKNAISDLSEMTNTMSNDPVLLKQSLQDRINRLFQECTMKGEADKQLHNFLMPLLSKINQLDKNEKTAHTNDIQSYLGTFKQYFK